MFEETKLEQKPHFRLGFLKYEGGGPNVLVHIATVLYEALSARPYIFVSSAVPPEPPLLPLLPSPPLPPHPPTHLDQTSDHTCVLVEIWVPMTKNPQTGLLPVIIHHMRALFWTGQLVRGQDLKEIARCPNHCWSIFQVKKDPCALLFCSQSLI